MSEDLNHSEHATTLLENERWALVKRIASSRHLLKAPQLREILFYISRRALADNPSAITEQEIGCKVLGRRPDFNPNEDNIVRAQVRHLRRKLENYFSSEGADEPLILIIPKGTYLPRFEPRPATPPAPAEPSPKTEPPHAWRTTIVVWTVLIALGLVSLILLKLGESRHRLSAGPRTARADVFWSRLFSPGAETSVVVSDSSLVAMQDILDADIRLNQYLGGGYPERLIQSVSDRKLQAALRLISARQYTSLGDANIASKMLEVSRRYSAQSSIRYSRFCSVREFKTGNFILIGSRRGIPWEQLFESQLNFQLEEDHATRTYRLRNKSPRPGERATYGASGGDQKTYADVALLPNLGEAGSVLILAGIDMAATEAAGELVTKPDFPATLVHLLNLAPGQPLPPRIEFLVEAQAVGGTGEDSKILCYRISQ